MASLFKMVRRSQGSSAPDAGDIQPAAPDGGQSFMPTKDPLLSALSPRLVGTLMYECVCVRFSIHTG